MDGALLFAALFRDIDLARRVVLRRRPLLYHRGEYDVVDDYHRGECEDGYYDGTYVNMVQDGVFFIGGTKQADGQTTSDTDTTELDAELSKNLWPIKGALCAYTYDKKSFMSSSKVSNSYLLFVDDYHIRLYIIVRERQQFTYSCAGV